MGTTKKDLEFYRKNAEENYLTTPISVLRYISELEKELRQPPVVGSLSLTEGQIAHQIEMDDEEDSYLEDEDNFQCCDNCDLPDACRDYGCAIQQGLRRNEGF